MTNIAGMVDLTAATADRVMLPQLAARAITLEVLRLDKLHAVVSGNKWFKLKYHLQEAQNNQYNSILTFGGAYSNHIVATAFAAQQAGLQSQGIIRGEAPNDLSHTLKMAENYGMKLTFVDRDTYQKMTSQVTASQYTGTFAGHYIISEGGAGPAGEKGCREILGLVDKVAYTHICCAIGTATMYLGLINSSLPQQPVIGIPVLKGMNNLHEQLAPRIHPEKWSYSKFFYDYHFGGYAKKNNELFAFMNAFYDQSGIPTDFVYTGKLLYAVVDLVEKNYFPGGSRLLVVHSGGLQGNMSLPLQTLHF